MVIVSLWILVQVSLSFISSMFDSPALLVHFIMSTFGCKPHSSPIGPLQVAQDVDFYHDFMPEEDQATIPALEAEVKLVREFKDDEEIEQHVDGSIPDLGCTKTRKPKFFVHERFIGTPKPWWIWECYPGMRNYVN